MGGPRAHRGHGYSSTSLTIWCHCKTGSTIPSMNPRDPAEQEPEIRIAIGRLCTCVLPCTCVLSGTATAALAVTRARGGHDSCRLGFVCCRLACWCSAARRVLLAGRCPPDVAEQFYAAITRHDGPRGLPPAGAGDAEDEVEESAQGTPCPEAVLQGLRPEVRDP